MNEPVDMVKLVRRLPARSRGKACIVLTHEYKGQKKWAVKLAQQTDSGHVDLLEYFEQNKNLCKNIGQFLVANFFDFLKNLSQKPVLIVSGMEFLKATWAGQPNSVDQFAGHVETWNHNPCLLFVLQHDKILATRKFRRYRQHIFVVDQKETLALC